MQSILITLCWTEIVVLIVGVAVAIATSSGGDAAGRAMGTGYLVIGVIVLIVLFVLPALLLASNGYAVWLAMILAGLAGIPTMVLFIGCIVTLGELVLKKLRPR